MRINYLPRSCGLGVTQPGFKPSFMWLQNWCILNTSLTTSFHQRQTFLPEIQRNNPTSRPLGYASVLSRTSPPVGQTAWVPWKTQPSSPYRHPVSLLDDLPVPHAPATSSPQEECWRYNMCPEAEGSPTLRFIRTIKEMQRCFQWPQCLDSQSSSLFPELETGNNCESQILHPCVIFPPSPHSQLH